MPTDLRVEQTQAIGAASSDPPPPSDPASPRTGSTSVHQVRFHNSLQPQWLTLIQGIRGSYTGISTSIRLFRPRAGWQM